MSKKRLVALVAVLAFVLPLLVPSAASAYCDCQRCKFRILLGWFCWFPQDEEVGYCQCYEIEAGCDEFGDSCIIVWG